MLLLAPRCLSQAQLLQPAAACLRRGVVNTFQHLAQLLPVSPRLRVAGVLQWRSPQGPHRLVVRTSRCGRDNPGSTPGVDILGTLVLSVSPGSPMCSVMAAPRTVFFWRAMKVCEPL